MGSIILFLLVAVEVFLMVWALVKRKNHLKEKSIIRIGEFTLLAVFLLTGILEWGFRYYVIALILFIQAITAVIRLFKKNSRERPFRTGNTIGNCGGKIFLYFMALLIAMLCPQMKPIEPDGDKEVVCSKYTWTDETRIEAFASAKEEAPYRKLTVEFWYPDQNTGETYPLVIFSHGANGFSGCNQSTFQKLASHGYVVASIGHTYHALFTLDTEGKFTPIDIDFNKSIYAVNGLEDEEMIYHISQEWLQLRVDDENFVMDTIMQMAREGKEVPFSQIDTEKIGLFGHSLGGASSAVLGRIRDDISAVIVLDGSMLGEGVGFRDGKVVLNTESYPVPLLNVYAQNHYDGAKELVDSSNQEYYNFYAADRAAESYEVIFLDAGHLNFTDLPLFSPFLARQMGGGDMDAVYGVETMNQLVLEFFDCILKKDTKPIFEKEY